MGTDITMMVEARNVEEDYWAPLVSQKMWPDETTRTFARAPVLARNYELFSVLADVRNRTGRGAKQMRTIIDPDGHEFEWEYDTDDGGHDPLIPISNPKGIPDNASTLWKHWLDEPENIVYHDHSFLTLEELQSGQWDQVVYRDAVLSEEEYLALINEGIHPRQLARGVGGPGVLMVNEVEYAAGKRGEKSTAINARWREGTVRDLTPIFQHMMNAMTAAAKEVLGGPENIRILFAFDS